MSVSVGRLRQKAWVSEPAQSSPLLYAGMGPKGNMPCPRWRRYHPRTPVRQYLASLLVLNSIRRDAGLLDDLCPKRDIRFDDVGELRLRGALRLTSGDVELFAYVDCSDRAFHRLADAIDNPLGVPRWHDGPKPPRPLCFGEAL